MPCVNVYGSNGEMKSSLAYNKGRKMRKMLSSSFDFLFLFSDILRQNEDCYIFVFIMFRTASHKKSYPNML